MNKTYFQRVTKQTPTMFWINNPTSEHADWTLENGAYKNYFLVMIKEK